MAKMIHSFKGIHIATVSTVGQPIHTHIDRTCVRAFRTLLGEELYIVEGTLGTSAPWFTVSKQFKGFSEAWLKKIEIDAEINHERCLYAWGKS